MVDGSQISKKSGVPGSDQREGSEIGCTAAILLALKENASFAIRDPKLIVRNRLPGLTQSLQTRAPGRPNSGLDGVFQSGHTATGPAAIAADRIWGLCLGCPGLEALRKARQITFSHQLSIGRHPFRWNPVQRNRRRTLILIPTGT